MAWHFNGSSWTHLRLPFPPAHHPQRGYIDTITSSGTGDVWAFGYRTVATGPGGEAAYPLAEHWNGQAWSAVPVPVKGSQGDFNAIQILSPRQVWLIGARFPGKTLTDQWNGTSWAIVPSANAPSGGSVIWAAAHDAAGDIMAVGENLQPSAITPFAMIHRAGTAG